MRFAAAVAKVPVYVTENDIDIEDDAVRVGYTREALEGLHDCIAEGIDVRSYWA